MNLLAIATTAYCCLLGVSLFPPQTGILGKGGFTDGVFKGSFKPPSMDICIPIAVKVELFPTFIRIIVKYIFYAKLLLSICVSAYDNI